MFAHIYWIKLNKKLCLTRKINKKIYYYFDAYEDVS